jgi:uncharacterized protein (DUF362 family)
MRSEMTRRDVLVGGLGVAGLAAVTGWVRPAAAAAPADRSAEAPASPVAIQRCESYDPAPVAAALKAALNLVGGLGDRVRGKTVTIKVNLTGVTKEMFGRLASRTYHVHPAVVGALLSALDAAGAKRITIVDSLCYSESTEEVLAKAYGWDVAALKAAGGRKVFFENTRNLGSWTSYSRLKVPWGGYLWPAFDVNAHYDKTDFFISVAKLKEHATAGVTLACKNLFGMMPSSLYGDDAPGETSVSPRVRIIHEAARTVPEGVPAELKTTAPAPDGWKAWQWRVPRTVADVAGARPIDLAVIDGIEAMSGGEGAWSDGIAPVEPKVLLVGGNPVCTDAVSTAVMGYDPQAGHGRFPFPGENHLRLLAAAGVGAIDLKRIEVRGVPIEKALLRYREQPKGVASAAGRSGRSGPGMEAYAAACRKARLG